MPECEVSLCEVLLLCLDESPEDAEVTAMFKDGSFSQNSAHFLVRSQYSGIITPFLVGHELVPSQWVIDGG